MEPEHTGLVYGGSQQQPNYLSDMLSQQSQPSTLMNNGFSQQQPLGSPALYRSSQPQTSAHAQPSQTIGNPRVPRRSFAQPPRRILTFSHQKAHRSTLLAESWIADIYGSKQIILCRGTEARQTAQAPGLQPSRWQRLQGAGPAPAPASPQMALAPLGSPLRPSQNLYGSCQSSGLTTPKLPQVPGCMANATLPLHHRQPHPQQWPPGCWTTSVRRQP